MIEIQYGVVHSTCVKCHGVDGWVSIGCSGGFLVRWLWGSIFVCIGRLLGDGGCVLSSKGHVKCGLG